MLERIKITKFFNLLPLLVMLHITMGMPLVHPFVHAHSGHEEPIPFYNGHHFQNQTDHGEKHRCPICDFQASNQLHAAVHNATYTVHPFIDSLATNASPFSLKVAPQHFDARAPPGSPAAL